MQGQLVYGGNAPYICLIETEILCPDKVGRRKALPMQNQQLEYLAINDRRDRCFALSENTDTLCPGIA